MKNHRPQKLKSTSAVLLLDTNLLELFRHIPHQFRRLIHLSKPVMTSNQNNKRFQRGKGCGNIEAYSLAEKENSKWESYYKSLDLFNGDEAEWARFKDTCQQPLPVTFRITGGLETSKELQDLVEKKYIPLTKSIEIENEKIEVPHPIEFYPNNMAYQFNVSKSVLRKNEAFAQLQRFLVVENAAGNVSRQEAVSMVPPLFMDIKSHHKVLDMCAAPGSKTAQLIEALHSSTPERRVDGIVVANDSDYKRSHLLVHQVKRLTSPNLLVTNHDAQAYPRICTSAENPKEGILFDRILCDVPCSGDGTMRKNINVWRDWKVGNGLGLHSLQLNILLRGIQLLEDEGRLVYSTCSLNPVENEAIVAEALRQNPGKIRLVDVSTELQNLKRSPGLSTWKVANKAGKFIEKKEATGDANGKKKNGDNNIDASVFPPTEEEAKTFGLEKCLRVYPQQQNTGGFFIAVFEKVSGANRKRTREPSPEAEDTAVVSAIETKKTKVEETNNTQTTAIASGPSSAPEQKKERLPRDANEEPFVFLSPEHPVLVKCKEFFGISDEFPLDVLLVRNNSGEPTRSIYYVDPVMKPLLELNENKLKIVHSGIRMFTFQRKDVPCEWRIQNEGVRIITPFLSKRVIEYAGESTKALELLRTLATEDFTKFPFLREHHNDEFFALIENIAEGCIILKIRQEAGPELLYPIWRGKGSCNLMLPKEDLDELKHRMFGIGVVKKQLPTVASTIVPAVAEP